MISTPPHEHQPIDVLVTGASGRQGSAAARALLADGHRVRTMTRTIGGTINELAALGATPVIADLEDPESLDAVLGDVDAVFAVQTFTGPDGVVGEERQGHNLAEAAARANVAHVVYSSVGAADAASSVPHFSSKARIESALRAAGLPLTIIRPAFFMDNFNDFAVTVIDDGTVDVALALPPNRPLQMVATADIGMVAAAAVSDPHRFRGETIELAGDELTGPQIAEAIGEHLDRPARFTAVPLETIATYSAEMGAMFRFLDEHGYQADIPNLRHHHPGLHTLAGWLKESNFHLAGAQQ